MNSPRTATGPSTVQTVDFRRPNRISRDAVAALETKHESFSRRLVNVWSTRAHTLIDFEHLASDQLSMDDFTESLPTPTGIATIRSQRLGTSLYFQCDLPFALLLVERLLGGPGDAATMPVARRPTDLEANLIVQELLAPVVDAIDDTLRDIPGDDATLAGFETSPQPLQLLAPGELLLLLTYRVALRSDHPAQGLVSLAYPVTPLITHLDALVGNVLGDRGNNDDNSTSVLFGTIGNATVDVSLRLRASTFPAATIASLQPGDVIRLDHRADEPARVEVDDVVVATAHVGRRGRRMAMQIDTLSEPDEAIPALATTA